MNEYRVSVNGIWEYGSVKASSSRTAISRVLWSLSKSEHQSFGTVRVSCVFLRKIPKIDASLCVDSTKKAEE